MSSGLPIGLLLVDDDPLIRAGLGTILASDPGLKILGEAENGLRAIELASRLQPEVIMMDIRMPQLDGLGAMERILADGVEKLVTGDDVEISAITGGTDARLFTDIAGIPAVVYGPSENRLAHMTDEYIELDEVVGTAETLALSILDWCGYDAPAST